MAQVRVLTQGHEAVDRELRLDMFSAVNMAMNGTPEEKRAWLNAQAARNPSPRARSARGDDRAAPDGSVHFL